TPSTSARPSAPPTPPREPSKKAPFPEARPWQTRRGRAGARGLRRRGRPLLFERGPIAGSAAARRAHPTILPRPHIPKHQESHRLAARHVHPRKALFDNSLDRKGYRSHLVGFYRAFYTFDEESFIVWHVIRARQDIDDHAFADWERGMDIIATPERVGS